MVVALTAGIIYFQGVQNSIHKSIDKNDVLNVTVYGSKTTEVKDDVLIDNIIKWFNDASDIRINENFAGTTPAAGIIINLKSKETISILASGSDFEIQRNDANSKNVSYWAKQENIKEYLSTLATKTEGE